MSEMDRPHEVVALFQKAASFARDLLEENARLRQRVGEVEAETQKFAERYSHINDQSELLQNLFVATHRLHATLDRDEVLETIKEILTNLIGAQKFTIWLLDEAREGLLNLIVQEGFGGAFLELSPSEEELAWKALGGETWYRPDPGAAGADPVAVAPLKVGDRAVGVMVLHQLFPHRKPLDSNDQQVVELLSSQGGTALMSAMLYAEKNRAATAHGAG